MEAPTAEVRAIFAITAKKEIVEFIYISFSALEWDQGITQTHGENGWPVRERRRVKDDQNGDDDSNRYDSS